MLDEEKHTDRHNIDDDKKPLILIIAALLFAFATSFVAISLKKYGGFGYFGNRLVVRDVIAQSLGAVFGFPLIHIGIASVWKSKRNSRTRRNIFLGWALVVTAIQATAIFK